MAAPFSIDSLESFTLCPLAVWKPEKIDVLGELDILAPLFCSRDLSICCIMAAPFSNISLDKVTLLPAAV